ncbi:MAG: JAB domain-containing protein [Bacteroidota bacterium]|nr:JAB domain-containing protein [Bacteroidota bacterium]
MTKKLQSAASTLEIKVLGHLIFTEKTYFSFADKTCCNAVNLYS